MPCFELFCRFKVSSLFAFLVLSLPKTSMRLILVAVLLYASVFVFSLVSARQLKFRSDGKRGSFKVSRFLPRSFSFLLSPAFSSSWSFSFSSSFLPPSSLLFVLLLHHSYLFCFDIHHFVCAFCFRLSSLAICTSLGVMLMKGRCKPWNSFLNRRSLIWLFSQAMWYSSLLPCSSSIFLQRIACRHPHSLHWFLRLLVMRGMEKSHGLSLFFANACKNSSTKVQTGLLQSKREHRWADTEGGTGR